MKTRWIMIASALLLIIHGMALLFAPELIVALFTLPGNSAGRVTVQLLGAALTGFGLMNWTSRGLVLGGVYGRGVVYGNFATSFISFLVSARAWLDGFGNAYFRLEVLLCLAFACIFGFMLFRGPKILPSPDQADVPTRRTPQ